MTHKVAAGLPVPETQNVMCKLYIMMQQAWSYAAADEIEMDRRRWSREAGACYTATETGLGKQRGMEWGRKEEGGMEVESWTPSIFGCTVTPPRSASDGRPWRQISLIRDIDVQASCNCTRPRRDG